MKKIFVLFFLFSMGCLHSFAQTDIEPSPFVKTWFCILYSSKNYADAKKFAQTSSKQLHFKLDLRGLSPNKETGLTMTKKECKENSFEFPAYVARGRYDNNAEYISVESSDAFKGFARGYYIVIVNSGDKEEMDKTLLKVKATYKTAYVKQSEVYMGCMH
jgi:hypothetical protein